MALLTTGLAGRPCRVFSSDLRVRVLTTGLATYPDATVICGRLEVDPESHVTATNPMVLVEVTSPSTASYDEDGVWRSTRATSGQRARLSALGVELEVDEVYRDPLLAR